MGRRKELKGIAIDLANSINSRNSDYCGYWLTGQLHKFAHDLNTAIIVIDVLSETMTPSSQQFPGLYAAIRHSLEKQLAAKNIDKSWVSEFQLRYAFEQVKDDSLHTWIGVGYPYTVTLTIKTDRCVVYQHKTGGYCRPHDPSRENRSSRYS